MPDRTQQAQEWLDRRFTARALRPRNAAFVIAAIWVVAVIVFGIIERIADSETFPSIWLAFWWAIQTVTTVGYGDIVPGQASGKAMAAVLMIVGLAFLSVVTATITSVFVARRQAELAEAGKDPVMRRLDEIATRLVAIDAQLGSRRPDARPPDPPS